MNENNENLALLYSAYHKFYSALVSLERLNINNDLFDNISSLDTFFQNIEILHLYYKNLYQKLI